MDMRLVTHTKLQENGCLEWQFSLTSTGYGQIRVGRRSLKVHRYAWEQLKGPIPKGMSVCHKCDNPLCLNIEHLFLGSHTDNMRDMFSKNRRRNDFQAKGEQHHKATLTDEQVASIRDSSDIGYGSGRRLAAIYGVSESTISKARKHTTWRHI